MFTRNGFIFRRLRVAVTHERRRDIGQKPSATPPSPSAAECRSGARSWLFTVSGLEPFGHHRDGLMSLRLELTFAQSPWAMPFPWPVASPISRTAGLGDGVQPHDLVQNWKCSVSR